MKTKNIFLFGILLLSILLCSFLGGTCYEYFTTNTYTGNQGATATSVTTNQGNTFVAGKGPNDNVAFTGSNINGQKSSNTINKNNYDNYNHYDGTSFPTIFYGPNGGTARVIQTGNESTIITTNKDGKTQIYYISNDSNNSNTNIYYGPNGAVATIVSTEDGKQAINISFPDGSKIVFTEDNTYVYNSQDSTINDQNALSTNSYYGPNNSSVTTISGSQGGSGGTVTGPQGNTAYTYTGPQGNTYTGSNYNSDDYYNSLPPGIPSSQIPSGQEDLYILKSQVVPPVCPVCPEPIVQCPNDFDASKCPPCPPCARCPEPAFDCKKVPNYNSFNPDYLPVPVLNDFSSFGM